VFGSIAARIAHDKDLPERAWRIEVLRRVLDGTLYDVLPHPFHDERKAGGEYIPLRDRRPCVRYALCRTVVEDSVSLLFGEGRFPTIDCADEATREALHDLLIEAGANRVMIDAATRGSVGSVAILLRVLHRRIFLDVLDTQYLTPVWDPDAPDTLVSVRERYKVRGRALRDQGYDIREDELEADHWFAREWTTDDETWFLPMKVGTDGPLEGAEIDISRSIRHALGFVPVVWIRNLPGGEAPDGWCTFRCAVDAQIEIDYQLSQAGRGLKYSSDPTLLIKEPAAPNGEIVKGAGNALVVSEKGDARLLEIGGTASAAVLDYVRTLRELALESVHGNRSNADKVSAAQSGRAMEMMHQPLIWLADRLRISYGQEGLLRLARMIVAAAQMYPIKVQGRLVRLSATASLSLRWPEWFPPTGEDKQQAASTLATLRGAGLISRETAVKDRAPVYDVDHVSAELSRIAADEAAADVRAGNQGAHVNAAETLPE
jgi:hypothetical protein